MEIDNRQRFTVRQAIIEIFEYHKCLYSNAKKGEVKQFTPETVISWYEKGGSRNHLIELSYMDIESLSLSEIDSVLRWHHKITNCRTPCNTCGHTLYLDSEFWFIPFSFCEEYGCGIQICDNCVKILGDKQ